MRTIKYIWIGLILITFSTGHAQVSKSERTSIRLSTKPKEDVFKTPDFSPPELEIMLPEILEGEKFISQSEEIKLVGKVSDESGIGSLIINTIEVDVPPTGVFQVSIPLERGDNSIEMIALDSIGNYLKKEVCAQEHDPGGKSGQRIKVLWIDHRN